MSKKIKVRNAVPHLLEAATNHKDCTDWLKEIIYNGLAEKADTPADCAEMYRAMLKYAPTIKDGRRRATASEQSETAPTDADDLTSVLSSVLNNPHLPEKLKDEFKDALTEFTNDLNTEKNLEFFSIETSPEYLARLLKIAGGGE